MTSLKPEQVTLQNFRNSATAGAVSVTLSAASTKQSIPTSNRVVRLLLTTADFNSLSREANLATSISNTFLALGATGIEDLVQNSVEEVPRSTAAFCSSFTGDAVQPQLTNWTLDLTTRQVVLTFSEVVRASTFTATELTIVSQASATPSASFKLTGSTSASTTDGTTFSFTLSVSDTNSIKATAGLAVDRASTFLSLGTDAIKDMHNNLVERILTSQAVQVLSFTDDRFQPGLVSWEINLSTDTLTLSFNETVVTSQLNLTQFTIQDGETKVTNSYALANTRVSGANAANYTISLNAADTNEIKSLDLCSSTLECYATFPSSFAQDVVGLSVVARADGNGIQATSATADISGPSILSFTEFDLVKGELKISFSEIVNVSTFDPKEITLQTLFSNPLSSYTLTGGTVSTVNSDTVTVTLTSADLDKIKETENLCTHRRTCYLTATDRLVDDLSSNSNKAQGQGYPGLIVQSFTRDVTAPVLDRFELDLNTNVLSLTFSEPVRSSRLKTSEITLQSAVTSLGGQLEYTLTGGVLPTLDGLRVVNVNLTTTDANQLKQLSFASSTANTFIRLTADTANDMSIFPNKVTAIVDGQAKAAAVVTSDTTRPTLTAFALSINTDTLTLTFDEPMNWTSFDAKQLIFSSSTAVVRRLTGGTLASTTPSTSKAITLLSADVTAIKLASNFGTLTTNTLLSFAAGTVKDVSGNNNTAVTNQAATSLTVDTTRAQLQSFELDVEQGKLNLTFSDVVNASTFDARAFTVQSSATAVTGQSATLTSSSTTASKNGYVIIVDLSASDLLAIKSTTAAARSQSTTFLLMAASAIDDVNGRDVLAITDGKGKVAAGYSGDISKPTITRFEVDMSKSALLVTFSEPVDQSSLRTTFLTLQSTKISGASTETLSLTGGTASRSTNGRTITLTLSSTDLNTLNTKRGLLTSVNNSFISALADSVRDLFGNQLDAVSSSAAIQASAFTAETVGPSLVNFTLDANAGQLVLTFDESVSARTLNTSYITLQTTSDSTRLARETYRLTGGTFATTDGTTITVNISTKDLNEIKAVTALAKERASTYLSMVAGAVQDTFANPSKVVPSTRALQAASYTADSTRPQLSAFSVDMSAATMTFTFSETVNAAGFNPTQITVQNTAASPTKTYTLTGGSTGSTPSTVITLSLTQADVDALAKLDGLLTSNTDSFVNLAASLVRDMANELLNPVTRQADTFNRDNVAPSLRSFDLDMDSGLMTVSFSEVISFSSLNAALGEILTQDGSQVESLSGNSATAGSTNDVTLSLTLSTTTLNNLKLNTLLAVSKETTYLNLTAGFIQDTLNNLSPGSASVQNVRTFTPDTTDVSLQSFSMVGGSSELSLTFSEPVDVSTLDVTKIVLQNSQTSQSPGGFFRLTSSSRTSSADGTIVLIEVSTSDANSIRDLANLGTNTSNTFISATADTIKDMAGNGFVQIVSTNATQARAFTPDATPPTVQNFTLDMDAGTLSITFSETVDATTVDVTGVSLQSGANRIAGQFVTLTSSSTATRPSQTTVLISLSDADLDSVKQSRSLATSSSTTFLAADPKTVSDLVGNRLTRIGSTAGKGNGVFVPDTSKPTLTGWDLDVDAGFFVLSFSETVDVPAIKLPSFTLQDGKARVSSSFSAFSTAVPSTDSRTVNLTLSANDINAVRRNTLCFNGSNCFLLAAAGAVQDHAGNAIDAIADGAGVTVTNYTPDTTGPQLTQFVLFDVDSGVLDLSFNEPVQVSTAKSNVITLQDGPEADPLSRTLTTNYTLTGGVVTSSDSLTLRITLTATDLNAIKADTDLCTRGPNCFVRFPASFVVDQAGLAVKAVQNGPYNTAEFPRTLTPDTTSPSLQSFSMDLDSPDLTLTFSETIDVSEVNPEQLVVQNAVDRTTFHQLSVSSTVSTTADGTVVRVSLSNADAIKLKANTALATGTSSTFLTFASTFAVDMESNAITARVNNNSALQASSFTPDSTPPKLAEFSVLDLNSEFLQLSFDEPMSSTASSINFTLITLQSSDTSSAISQPLTAGSAIVSQVDRTRLQFSLNSEDVRQLKLQASLAVSKQTSYVSLAAGAFQDISGIRSAASSTTLNVVTFVPDTTSPGLLSYTLDMQLGRLSLSFSDVMNVRTLAVTKMRLQSNAAGSDAANIYTLTASSTTSSANGYSIVIDLSTTDLNAIKARSGLATSRATTFFSSDADALQDMSGVNMIAITSGQGQQVSTYTKDTTEPVISSFTFDVTTGDLVITMSETINTTSVSVVQFTLQNKRSSATRSRTLTGGTVSPSTPTSVITIKLDVADLNDIKKFADFGTTTANTFLAATADALSDMDKNKLKPILTSDALNASSHTQDTDLPVLQYFELNMDTAQIVVRFSETVNATSVVLSRFVLLAAAGTSTSASPGAFRLTGGTSSTVDSNEITITVSTADLNSIKSDRTLATAQSNTFLRLDASAVSDNADLALAAMTAGRLADAFTADNTAPRLVDYDVDMAQGTVFFTFSEVVDVLKLNMSQLTFRQESTGRGSFYQLTGGTTNARQAETFTVSLTATDLNAIKKVSTLLTAKSNTFLEVSSGFITDMQSLAVTPILFSAGKQVRTFTGDTTNPTVTGFELNLNTNQMIVSFSEVVRASGLKVTSFVLQDKASSPSSTFRLTTATTTSTDTDIVTFGLSNADVAAIQRSLTLAVDTSSTFLSVDAGAVNDTSNNPLSALAGLQTKLYTGDSGRPVLQSYTLSMVGNTVLQMVLSFSEVVDVTSFNVNQLRFRSSPSSASYTLTGGAFDRTTNASTITVNVTSTDLAALRARPPFLTSASTSLLTFPSTAVKDMAGQSVQPKTDFQVTTYTADLTPPVLSFFSLDLTAEELRLTFSEAIIVTSLTVSRITLQAASNTLSTSTTETYTLTRGTVSAVAADNKQAVVKLDLIDLNAIKQKPLLAISLGTTYISLPTRAVVLDIAENQASIIARTAAKQATSFVADSVRPRLESFDFNSATSTLTLRFSETMNIGTFSAAGSFVLQSTQNNVGSQRYTLTGANLTTTTNTSTVVFGLLEKDHNEVLKLSQLAVSRGSTFISITGSLLQDTAGNDVQRIASSNALQVAAFVSDTEQPQLVSASLNLNTNQLVLSFSETVNAATFAVTDVVLQDNTRRTATSYQLTTSTVQTTNSAQLTVTLATVDANAIKKDAQLCTSASNCYVRFPSSLVTDMTGLAVVAVTDGSAVQFSFTADSTAPKLLTFESINLVTGQLTLSFDETVDVSTFAGSEIILQSFFEQPLSSVNLTGGTIVGGDSSLVTLNLTKEDLTTLRADSQVCASRTSCYITVGTNLVSDMNGVKNAAVQDGSPGIVVRSYTKDTTLPTLSSFDLDLDGSGTLTLHFSEPVTRTSLTPTSFTLQNAITSTLRHQLTGGTVTAVNSSSLQVALTASDLSAVKAASFASNASNTFLSFTANAVTDTSANAISALADGQAVGVNQYTADSSAPTLQDFLLDLTSHKLRLTFSEPVDPVTVKSNLFTFYSTNNTQTASNFTLTTGSTVDTTVASSTIVLSVSAGDIATLKRNSALATTSANTYLSLVADAVRDAAGQPIGALSPTLSKQAFAGDTSRAQLSGFSIDMHQSIVRLTFTDLVRASSLDASAITIQDAKAATAGKAISLSTTSTTSSSDGYVLVVNIAAADLLRIKKVKGVATSQATTWMTLGAHAVDDLNALDVLAVTNGNALQANPFTGDTTVVALQSFTLDMDGTPVLSMTFTDTVDLATLQLTSITLQSSRTSSRQSVTLSGGTTALSSDGTSINVTLLASDSDRVKLNTALATSLASTFLSLPGGSVKDLAGNNLTAVSSTSATQATLLTPDTTSPEIQSWQLDMDLGQVTLSFNEAVQASSLSGVGLSLQPYSSNAPVAERFSLTGKASSTTADGTTLVLNLTAADLNSIKAITTLAVSSSSSFLVATSASVKDMNNRNLKAIPNTGALALAAGDFTRDSTAPSLSSFSVNMNTGLIEFTFDETILASTVQLREITLIAGAGSSVLFPLTGGTVSTTNSANINITLSTSDLNSVKLLTGLYTAKSTAFISFTSDAFRDMQSRVIPQLPATSARQVNVFVADSTAPSLESWTLDMNGPSMVLSFSEPVNATSLTPAFIDVRSASTGGLSYSLTTSSTSSANGLSLTISLSPVDTNAIKTIDGLAVSQATSYLVFTAPGAVSDMAGNRASTSTTQASAFTADTTAPLFQSFTLDLNTGKLQVTFDESVRTTSLSFPNIELRATASSTSTSEVVDLQSGVSSSTSANQTTIEISLGTGVLNELKSKPLVGTSISNTYLHMGAGSIQDTAGNNIAATTKQSSSVTADTSDPQLVSYTLSLANQGVLTLTFSEYINDSSLDLRVFNFQPTSTGGASVALTGRTSLSSTGLILTITLLTADVNSLKENVQVATLRSNTFAFFSTTLVSDMSGRPVKSVTSSNGFQASQFVADSTRPKLDNFDLDLDNGVLTLVFDETINITSLTLSDLFLQSNARDRSVSVQLSGGTFDSSKHTTTIPVTLTPANLNSVKEKALCTLETNCFLSYSRLLVKDVFSNDVVPAAATAAKAVRTFTNDTTAPKLVSFVRVNLQLGTVELSFSETVRVSSAAFNQLTLQQFTGTSGQSVRLTGGTTASADGTTVLVTLTKTDLDNVKLQDRLCENAGGCHVTMTSSLITDMADNAVEAVTTGQVRARCRTAPIQCH